MRRPNPQEKTNYVYFVGETDVFRYETSVAFAASVRQEYPDLAQNNSKLSAAEIGMMIGESLDNDALELRLRTQPENRVFAGMVLLAETFLTGSKSFQTLRDTSHNSILYSVFRLAEGGYLIRSCGSFAGTGLLSSQGAIERLCSFISIPFLRSRFDSDNLSPSSAYRQIVQKLDSTVQ